METDAGKRGKYKCSKQHLDKIKKYLKDNGYLQSDNRPVRGHS